MKKLFRIKAEYEKFIIAENEQEAKADLKAKYGGAE